MLRLLAVALVLVLVAAACGGDDSSDDEPGAAPTTSAEPTESVAAPTETEPAPPPPAASDGLPTVVVASEGTEAPLPSAGGCWRDADGLVTCGDPPRPSCGDPGIPTIETNDDGALRLSVDAAPESLVVLWEDGTEDELPPSDSVAWRPTTEGLALVQVDLGTRGSGAFAVCVEIP